MIFAFAYPKFASLRHALLYLLTLIYALLPFLALGYKYEPLNFSNVYLETSHKTANTTFDSSTVLFLIALLTSSST